MGDFNENILTTLKILIIGESSVGKSRWAEPILQLWFTYHAKLFTCKYLLLWLYSLLLRFIHDRFDDDLGLTIGVDFKTKTIMIDGQAVKLAIWVNWTKLFTS